jgi:hypothetical protein
VKTALLRIGCAICVGVGMLTASQAQNQKPLLSPPASTSQTVDGKTVSVDYSAPSMRGRKIFGGLLPYGKVWRTGANAATTLKTGVDLQIGDAKVPAGTYTLYTLPSDGTWKLIINKQTGQWGLSYDASQDLGRVKMTMSKPPAEVERMKYTLTSLGGNKVQLQLAWENHVATVPITVK